MRRPTRTLLSLVLLSACGANATPQFTADQEPPLTVTRGNFANHIVLSGELQASESIGIHSPPEGWGLGIRWLAEDGTLVKKGDKVLEMDTTAIASELDAAEASYLKAGSELAQQQNNAQINRAEKAHLLRQAEITLKKAKRNADVPADAYPRRVYEDMQLALTRAQSGLATAQEATRSQTKLGALATEQARIALAKAEREITSLNSKLRDYIITAPKDGIIIRVRNRREGRSYEVGDKTWPGREILKMPNLQVMTVDAELSDVDDGRIHVAMEANCSLDAYPDKNFTGRILSISPVAKAPTYQSLRRAFDVKIQLSDTDPTIMRPGMSVQVALADKVQNDVLIAPRAGLVFEGKDVYASFSGGQRQSIEIGACSAQSCVVVSGLEAGAELQRRGAQ